MVLNVALLLALTYHKYAEYFSLISLIITYWKTARFITTEDTWMIFSSLQKLKKNFANLKLISKTSLKNTAMS